MAFIARALREAVIQRAQGLCEYCQTSQNIVIEMEIDHIIPESSGGETTEHNLCLACISCNNAKSDAQTGLDLETQTEVPLFNPRTQSWQTHFRWATNGTQVLGLTPTGRATVDKLRMNRELVVKARERWVKAGWHPPT